MNYKLPIADRVYVSFVLTVLLGLTIVLYVVVKTWEVSRVKRKCGHCAKTKVFYLWELLFNNCWQCRRSIRIGRHVTKKYGGAI